MPHKQVEGRATFLLRVCAHSNSTQVDSFGFFLEYYLKMNICTSAVEMPTAWAVEIESITKNLTLGHCALQRTSLFSWVCGDSYGGDWNTHKKKPAEGKLSGFKVVTVLKKIFHLDFLSLFCLFYHPLSVSPTRAYPHTRVPRIHARAHARTRTHAHAHSRWWRMMAEAGTEPVSDLSCNRGNRAPIDPLGERPGISFHTHAHIQ